MRRDDWPERLMEVVDRHAAMPFAYGVSDCWTLAADAIEAMTGERPYAGVRYASKAGAARALAKRGFATVEAALAAILPDVPAAMAGRGDVGVVETPDGPAAVVCTGLYFAGKGEGGLDHVPREFVHRAFGVR